jgi:hypothetical protein
VAAALALALGAAQPARGEVRRVEVVGAVALDGAAPPPAAPRQAALEAALEEAVARVAASLIREATGAEPPPDAVAGIGGDPRDFAVSFGVLEDRGELAATLAGDASATREYVVVAEVRIDAERLRGRLRAAGRLAPGSPPAPAHGRFRLEVLDLPSPAAYGAIRSALRRAGAEAVVPLEIERGRALLEVTSALAGEATVSRLLSAPLAAPLALERIASEPERFRVRVLEALPRAAPERAEAPGPN